jgi:hypothetical protein
MLTMLPFHSDALHSGFATAEGALHLALPYAASESADWWPTMQALAPASTPQLRALLKGMGVVARDAGPATSLSPPHERLLARELGWQGSRDGLLPWAAWQQGQLSGQSPHGAWAWVNLCHWAMGREHATLADPATLELNDTDSRALLAAMQPYFATEGITLNYAAPTRWLARGDVFASLPTASLDRVLGRNVDRWLPSLKQIKLLQNEMQMLLYTHPINDERASQRQRSINSFWVSGSGALIEPAMTDTHVNTHVNTSRALVQAACANDWPAYAQAWTELDASDIAQLLTQQNSGDTVRISLCGESQSMTFETAQIGLLTKIRNALSPQPAIHVLQQL